MHARVLGEQGTAQVDPPQRVVLRPQRPGLDSRAATARHADADERSPVGKRVDAVHEVLAADRVQYDVDAPTIRQLAHPVDEALARVVAAVADPVRRAPPEL